MQLIANPPIKRNVESEHTNTSGIQATVHTVQPLPVVITQKAQRVAGVLPRMSYLNLPQYRRAKPAAFQEMMVMNMMMGKVGDGRNSDTEVWWSDTGCNVKDGVPYLIRSWVTDGRKQIMLSFGSILLWQPLTNYLSVLWRICLPFLRSKAISHVHNDIVENITIKRSELRQ